VFGRYRCRRIVRPDGTVHTTTVELPRGEWPVVIHDHHPGYISWDDFLANQTRLKANTTNQGARPPREGQALCQGILHCGGCGRPMSTRYHPGGRAAYECAASRADQTATPGCRSVAAATLDEAVTERLLAALNPEEVALALAAATEVADRHARSNRAAELAVERARYQADRAERAFLACEPENRLVARSLEARWEAKLVALAEAEQALAATQARLTPLPQPAELEALTSDLPRLWHAPTTQAKDRKRMLRTLIADVTVLPEPDRAKLRLGIRWHSGATDELLTSRRPSAIKLRRTPVGAVELLQRLGSQRDDAELADRLNQAGYLTGAGRPFDVKAVRWLRHVHHVPTPAPFATGELSVAEVAQRLGISANAVYYWVQHGQLQARRTPAGRWCVPFGPEVEAACRQKVADSAHLTPPTPTAPAGGAV
jgi:Recombinase zinc beta ribbon domain